ncbi:MAG: hypothetical protein QM751_13900 [Paludibacteraceae bacterium]
MKKEQQKNPDNAVKSDSQPKSKNQQGHAPLVTDSEDHSNVSVDSEGRIGKPHEWDDKKDDQRKKEKKIVSDSRPGNDKTTTGPEIDAPIYDPEKTEKKIPTMSTKDQQQNRTW